MQTCKRKYYFSRPANSHGFAVCLTVLASISRSHEFVFISHGFSKTNPSIFIAGCPCHLAHLVASEANDAFTELSGINIENIMIDLFYWFAKSSKRKGKLSEYFEFCDQEYQKVLKHISVRWLSLERCVDRVLKKLPSLKSYFQSEHFADERFQRLDNAFSNPLFETVL